MRNSKRIALTKVGFGLEDDYVYIAVKSLYKAGYPANEILSYLNRHNFTIPVVDDAMHVTIHIKKVIEAIKRRQYMFYFEIVQATHELFHITPQFTPKQTLDAWVKQLVRDSNFLYHNYSRSDVYGGGLNEEAEAFQTSAMAECLRKAGDFAKDDLTTTHWVNHNTLKMAAVAQLHGIVGFATGEWGDYEICTLRQAGINPTPCLHIMFGEAPTDETM